MTLPLNSRTLILGLAVLATGAPAVAEESDAWQFRIGPYLWAAGLDGDMVARGEPVDVDVGFDDILDNLDGTFMNHAELEKGGYGLLFDLLFLGQEVDADHASGLVTDTQVNLDTVIVELAATARATDNLQLYAGVRYIDMELDLKFNLAGNTLGASGQQSWVDPIVGAKYVHELNDRWTLNLRGDVGGFGVNSDLTWNASAIFGYAFGSDRNWIAGFGYRALSIDYDDGDGDQRFEYDVTTSGPIAGIQRRF